MATVGARGGGRIGVVTTSDYVRDTERGGWVRRDAGNARTSVRNTRSSGARPASDGRRRAQRA